MYWDKMDKEDRELDRQYYLSKIDELGRCLPVVRAAQEWLVRPGVQRRIDNLVAAIEAFEAAEKVKP
jgi:hypothetical protein